jgi:chromate transporter
MIAVSESTPGPIGINMSTYAGFTTGGVLGGVVASIGLAVPSVIIILIVAQFLKKFAENKYVLSAFYGLRAASVGLIAAACFLVVKIALLNIDAFEASRAVTDLFRWKALLLAAVLYAAMKKLSFHPVVFLAASAVVGIVFRFAGA